MPTPNLPNPESYEQILSDMLSSYASALGVDDFNIGAVNLSFFEVVALMSARASGDLFQILRDYSVDRATGDALKRLAAEYGVIPGVATVANGYIDIIDTSFTKIATAIYAGATAPNVGATLINISNGSAFPLTGSVYIGRGTPNIEGPIPYTGLVQVGSYWTITLSVPTAKYHNLNETVILAQGGNRTISANTIVISPGIGSTASIQYSVVANATILDGETEVDNVLISALLPGSNGNVPANSITQFASAPFPGAIVNNPLPLTTGTDNATDAQIRVQIKQALASLGLGTVTAIESSLLGQYAADTNQTIVSDSLITNVNGSATVYVGDGGLYEATTMGVGLESIVDSAIGGEYLFQLQTGGTQAPVAKAFLLSTLSAPFDLVGGDTLAIIVGEVEYQHVFQTTDFLAPGAATAFEVTASINADSILGFQATTSGGGIYVVIRAKAETNDSLQTTIPTTTSGRNASIQLGFPSRQVQTLRLYKNDVPLTKDGLTASVFTQAQAFWSPTIGLSYADDTASIAFSAVETFTAINGVTNYLFTISPSTVTAGDIYTNNGQSFTAQNTISGGTYLLATSTGAPTSSGTLTQGARASETLILSVDGTNFNTYFITDADFLSTGLYTVMAATNSLSSWVEVLNDVLTGVTASIIGDQIELTSNLGADDRASITISPSSSLVIKGMFNALSGLMATGKASDFTLDRNTAQFQLVVPLVVGDKLSAGDANTEAFIKSSQITSGTLTFTSDAHFWVLLDTPGTIIPTAVVGNTSLTVSQVAPNIIRYTSAESGAFVNVLPGDYVIAWSPELPTTDQIEGRVHAITSTTLDVLITAAEYALITPTTVVILENGFVVLRSVLAPQKFTIPAGTYTLYQIVSELQTQTENVLFSVFLQQYIKMVTSTMDDSGSLLVVTADLQAVLLQFLIGASSQSTDSLIAYENSQDYAGELPLFINSVFSDAYAHPIDTFVTSITSSVNISERDPNELIGILHPYGIIRDAQPYGEYVQETSISGNSSGPSTVGITEDVYLRRVRSIDRFFIANPLDFGQNDTVVTILNNDVVNESFTIPLYRQALVNTSYVINPNNFDAYDVQSGPTAQFSTAFGANFDFSNFKVLMQAKHVLAPVAMPSAAILYRSTPWGRSGEKITVGYSYPSAPNQPISSLVTVGTTVAIAIFLGSGNAVPTSIDSTTEWNVTIMSNDPAGTDQVTYSWAGEYTFTVSPANATAGAIYQDSVTLQFFSVDTTIATGTTLATHGLGKAPSVSGTLNLISGTGDATIVFSSYVFAGFGTNPNLTSVVPGDYVNISTQSGFNTANTGTFSVSSVVAPTPTSFTVQRPTGIAVVETDALTTVNTAITFYTQSATPTTAAAVVAYVNASLSLYISAELANGSSGSAIIAASTFEDSGFNYPYVQLLDGINWLASSDLTGSPQFVFKKPLAYDSDGTYYAFNNTYGNGDTVVFVPTTMDQVERLISIFAVSGFISDGNINLADRNKFLELSTDILGSLGSLQITGGTGNLYQVPVLDASILINSNYMEVPANNVASVGVHSDQWLRLQASTPQKKDTGIYSNTDISIMGNDPASGFSEIRLTDRVLTQRYFGRARVLPSLAGYTFRVEKQGDLVCVTYTGSDPAGLTTYLLATSYSESGTVTVSLVPNTTDAQIVSTTSIFSALSIWDYVTISGLSASNNGTFLVTGVSDDGMTLQITNTDATPGSGAATFTATLGVQEGDSVIFGAPFSNLNQGTFRVIRRFNDSIWIENVDAIEEEQVLLSTSIEFYEYEATIPGDKFVITGNVVGASNAGTFTITQVLNTGGGHYNDTVVVSTVLTTTTITESLTATVVSNTTVEFSSPAVYTIHAGDTVTIGGVTRVIDIIISQSIVVVAAPGFTNGVGLSATLVHLDTPVNLTGYESAVYVLEGIPYNGYKHVYLVSAQPDSPNQNLIVFDTIAQYEKINSAAGVEMTSLSKLNFSTAIEVGLDGYAYNTGLIREANRIIYGDPRDPITYPGVGAAGADIFAEEPLLLRVTMSLDIRLLTGVSFTAVSQQVRSNVAALVNSNPIGESIPISSIISIAGSVPGVASVAINSPLYSATNDLISVQPSEQTIIINPMTDIAISQIGS